MSEPATADVRPGPDAPAVVPARPDTPAGGARRVSAAQLKDESALEFYARRIAGATMFIAWVIGDFAVASLIVGVIVGIQISHLNTNLLNGGSPSSNCLSQGGTDPSC